MKKLLLILLTAVYMLSASGLAMQIHYCMGEKVGLEFFSHKDEKCGKCGMTERKGCCSDEHRFFKLSIDHQKAGLVECPSPLLKNLPPSGTECLSLNTEAPGIFANYPFSPPRPAGLSLCRRYCIYRL